MHFQRVAVGCWGDWPPIRCIPCSGHWREFISTQFVLVSAVLATGLSWLAVMDRLGALGAGIAGAVCRGARQGREAGQRVE